MLRPGCVSHGIPQTKRIRAAFPESEVAVIGLHTVFEHHAAMEPVSLQAFLFEYGITFPVGVDAPSEKSPTPKTMQAWGQRGMPTLYLLDGTGRIRAAHLGQTHDMIIGAEIATLLAEDTESIDAFDNDAAVGLASKGTVCRPTARTETAPRDNS